MRCSSFSFSNPDWQVFASPPKRTPLCRDRWSHVALDHWECACDVTHPKWSRSQGRVIICKSCLQSCTKCLSRHISGIFVCYSLSIWVFLQSYKTADSPNSQYIEFSIEVFSLSPAATAGYFTQSRDITSFQLINAVSTKRIWGLWQKRVLAKTWIPSKT